MNGIKDFTNFPDVHPFNRYLRNIHCKVDVMLATIFGKGRSEDINPPSTLLYRMKEESRIHLVSTIFHSFYL
jgi:hypothetical protein